mmetsp:Transcript_26082/g.66354  ORF Transcript_26082/g.66354 Transcript_26082/m.66354 type:complete len:211 (-) Transcript_26082:4746-5378(-)
MAGCVCDPMVRSVATCSRMVTMASAYAACVSAGDAPAPSLASTSSRLLSTSCSWPSRPASSAYWLRMRLLWRRTTSSRRWMKPLPPGARDPPMPGEPGNMSRPDREAVEPGRGGAPDDAAGARTGDAAASMESSGRERDSVVVPPRVRTEATSCCRSPSVEPCAATDCSRADRRVDTWSRAAAKASDAMPLAVEDAALGVLSSSRLTRCG